jgi:uncharacterized protein YjbI with pentapeptide repeats
MGRAFIRVLLVALCWAVLLPACTWGAPGEDIGGTRGANGPLKREDLVSYVQGEKGLVIDNYIIQGRDLIAFIQEHPGVAIQVTHAIIEGGLDFRTIPPTPLEAIVQRITWSQKEKDDWMARKHRGGVNAVPLITSNIWIEDTDIRASQPRNQGPSSDAGKAFFSGGAIFWSATFSSLANFSEATFSGPADFFGATFSGGAGFGKATFSGEANFARATFSGGANFSEATFSGEANFVGARFDALALFRDARFFNRLILRAVLIKSYADFRNAYIRRLDVQNAVRPGMIEGRLDFRKARISEAHLQDVTFEKDVNFSDVLFGAPGLNEARDAQPGGTPGDTCAASVSEYVTVFRFVTFEGHADFLRTCFAGPTSFERVTFRKDANFTGATVKGHAESGKPAFVFSYVNVAQLRTKWAQLPDPGLWAYKGGEPIRSFVDREEAKRSTEGRRQGQDPPAEDRQELEPLSEVFKSLEATFRSQNQLEDANAAYYAMKIAELQEARRTQRVWQRVGVEAEWLLWGVLCGYGTKLWWVVGWALGVNVLCTVLYSLYGTLHRRYNPETREDFTFKPRPWDFPKDYLTPHDRPATPPHVLDGEAWPEPNDKVCEDASPSRPEHHPPRTLIDALRFSSTILFKIGYRDTTVSGRLGPCDLRWLVRLEWALGFYLMAALTYTLGSTQPLLNKLVHGVF